MSRNSTALRSAWSRASTLEIDDEMEILMNHGNLMNYPKEVLETIEFAVCDPKNPAIHTDSYWVWVGLNGQMLRRYDCD